MNNQLSLGIHLPNFSLINHCIELSCWVVKGDLHSDRKIIFFIQSIIRSWRNKLNEGKIMFL